MACYIFQWTCLAHIFMPVRSTNTQTWKISIKRGWMGHQVKLKYIQSCCVKGITTNKKSGHGWTIDGRNLHLRWFTSLLSFTQFPALTRTAKNVCLWLNFSFFSSLLSLLMTLFLISAWVHFNCFRVCVCSSFINKKKCVIGNELLSVASSMISNIQTIHLLCTIDWRRLLWKF